MLTHELCASTFRYDPNTGAVYLIGKDTPIATKTKSGNAIRCQIQTADTYKDTTAHAVAWVLLTGKDLPKNHRPQHINGDTFDNRAANLYLEIENDEFPWYTFIMADAPLARLIYPRGTKTGETWTAHQIFRQQEPLHDNGGLGEQYRARLVMQQGHRPAGPEFQAAWKKTPIDNLENFAAWIVQKRQADAAFTGLAPKGFHL